MSGHDEPNEGVRDLLGSEAKTVIIEKEHKMGSSEAVPRGDTCPAHAGLEAKAKVAEAMYDLVMKRLDLFDGKMDAVIEAFAKEAERVAIVETKVAYLAALIGGGTGAGMAIIVSIVVWAVTRTV